MEIIILAFFGILGTLIGSFLNVVVLRFNTGQGIGGRSACMHCSAQLRWYELVPIVSYICQKGKCRSCKSKISKQYILVEIVTAILFMLVASRILLPFTESYGIVSIINLLISLSAVSILVVIFVYDLHHKIIPDILSVAFAGFALMRLVLFYQSEVFSYPGILDLLAGPLIAIPFALLWYFSRGKWMGFGDAKLAIGIGWFLGFAGSISALCLAFWIGAVISVLILFFQKKKRGRLTFKSEVPFAPFLVVGLVLVYFFPMDLMHIKTILELI